MLEIRIQSARITIVVACVIGWLGMAGCSSDNSGTVELEPPPETLQRGSLVEEARPPRGSDVYYIPPRLEERMVLQDVLPSFFEELTAGATDFDHYKEAFRRAGFRMHRLRRGDDIWLVLSEGGEQWRGTGVYVFRLGTGIDEIILQAPHSYHDLHTGTIAERLFESMNARGLFFNSLHRYRPFPEAHEDDRVNPSDLAHATDSFFHHLSVEFLSATASGVLIQLHGYDRRTLEKKGIGVVLSDGSDTPSEAIERLRGEFGEGFSGHGVALYPKETMFYGATSNAQASWVHEYGRGEFIHVELAPDARELLTEDDEALYRFGEVLSVVF